MREIAILAGGCFWCMVKPFTSYEGVEKVVSGYIGGHKENPTYKEVCSGGTGHYEAVEITFDNEKIKFKEILDIFWKQIDPQDENGQFADRGSQYKTAIFYTSDKQKEEAQVSKKRIEDLYFNGKEIATGILEASHFYPAEDYHQNYCKTNSKHYSVYYKNSGRYNFVKAKWDRNNLDRNNLRNKLRDIEFEVTQNDMTEVPFDNEYFDKFDKGIYVDLVDGRPLFSSSDKFDSGCGWPAFSKPIEDTALMERADYSFGMERTEVRSLGSNCHLGHVFNDNPNSDNGLRYCINSAAIKFIPYDKMEECGYGEYKKYVK
ncbi:peptide-methionine (S)-S-oxide reductase MsrA [Peptostreptococcus stomatis]|uniref:peptide-methionine (S)-S-oxide reductase MsrA n=1 Tax=Peptostreptococcus stomatis TaxID=341694 RepID=UPI0028DCC993|nr:peptide-methionine (S)-S-oxide reductase MsrA [Peptostreptococcus stomatis]